MQISHYSFNKGASLKDLQAFGKAVYSLPDDRMFSIWDLLSNQERFTMRALKGIRKNDHEKLKKNLLIGGSWLLEIANRLHIDLDDMVWQRFPNVCSYCGSRPCMCTSIKPTQRKSVEQDISERPQSLAELQAMFRAIYPPQSRSIADAGVHLAEEVGEVNEAIQVYLGEHKPEQFMVIEDELADLFSCIVGVANSVNIDLAAEYVAMYHNNCHVCHHAPCTCNFSFIATFAS